MKKLTALLAAMSVALSTAVFADGGMTWVSWDDKSREISGDYKVASYSYLENDETRNYRVDFDAEVTAGDYENPAVYIRTDGKMNGFKFILCPGESTVVMRKIINSDVLYETSAKYDFKEKNSFFASANGDEITFGTQNETLISYTDSDTVKNGYFAADCGDGKMTLSQVKFSKIQNTEDEYYIKNPHMDYKKSGYAEEILKAKALGLMTPFEDGSFMPKAEVTRALLAEVIVKTVNAPISSVSYSFNDVKTDDKCYRAAAYCALNGYLNAENGNFYPERTADYSDAVRAFTLISGRLVSAENEYDIFLRAAEAGITKGVRSEGALTREVLAKLAVNTAECEYMYMASAGDRTTFKTTEGETVLSRFHNIRIISGRITENSRSGLYSSKGCREGYVIADNYLIETAGSDISEYLGMYVDIYARYDKDNDSYSVVYFSENSRKNKTLTVEADEICDGTTSQKLAYERDGRVINEELPKNLIYIYNGAAAPYEDGFLKPEHGSVTLINDGGEWFAAVIRSYETMYSGSVSYTTGEIYDKYTDRKIVLDDSVCTYEIYENGSRIPLLRVYQNRVLSVAASADKKHFTVYVSAARVTGVFSAESDNPDTVTVDGTEYKFRAYGKYLYENKLVQKPGLGETVSVYFDFAGAAAFMLPELLSETYGYLAAVAEENKLDGRFKAGIITAGGEIITDYFADKVNLNGTDTSFSDEIPDILKTSQLIQFKRNSKGKIIKVNTAQNGDYASAPVTNGPSYTKVKYVSSNSSLDSKVYIDWKTVVIGVPKDKTKLEDYICSKKAYFKDGNQYTVKCYNVNCYDVPEFVIADESAAADTVPKLARLFIVDGVGKSLSANGTESTVLKGFTIGKSAAVNIAEGCEDKFYGLRRGDAVLLIEDSRGRASGFTPVYRISGGQTGSGNPGASLSVDRLIVTGHITKLDKTERRVRINLGTAEKAYYFGNVKTVYEYSKKADRLSVSSFSNLDAGDYVVCNFSWGAVNDTIIYKD